MVTLIATVVVLGGLIFVHELGHFLVAKATGVRVHEFALGFGPRLLGLRRGHTDYSLRLLPLGGFVRMAGMHPGEEQLDEVPPPARFYNRSIGERMAVIFAGPLANLLLAAVLFVVLFAVIGVASPSLVVADVEPGFPADAAGIRPGDRIVALDGERLEDWSQLVEGVQSRPGRSLELTIERDGREQVIQLTPVDTGDGRGVIGIRPVMQHQRFGLLESVEQGLQWTARVVAAFFAALGDLVRGQGPGQIIGPVGIGAEIGEATRTGLPNLVLLAGLLS
ncbi:MAG TPA: M50 family metallopeptidase, partial [Bacillota bacterium]